MPHPLPAAPAAPSWRPRPRQRLAIALARGSIALLRALRIGGGTTLPGHLALLLAPDLLGDIAERFPDGIVLLSATNGKTTTTAILRTILERTPIPGEPAPAAVATNSSGANLPHGILASLLQAPAAARLAVLEVDEAYLPALAIRLKPHLIVLGALFRDQLDRHGEIDAVAARWRVMVAGLAPGTSLVISADDPRLEALVPADRRVLRCGIDDPSSFTPSQPGGGRPLASEGLDTAHCQRCGQPYRYVQRFYGHLGDYYCPSGDHRRGELDLRAEAVRLHGHTGVRFRLRGAGWSLPVQLPLAGLHNLENALSAAAAALVLGRDPTTIAAALNRVRPAFGRGEQLQVEGRHVLLNLIKNPIAADQTLRTIAERQSDSGDATGDAPNRHTLLLALHDGDADSRDISWIWDIDLETLLDTAAFPAGATIHLAGDRGVELALRLRYAGAPAAQLKLHGDAVRAFASVLAGTAPGDSVIVLATYSPLLRLHRHLAARGATPMFWSS